MMIMKDVIEIFRSSIIAGFAISIGGIVYLKLGGIFGAILFSFGLLTVIHYRLKLFTGTAGFIKNWAELGNLVIILLGNIVGCYVVALSMQPILYDAAERIVLSRQLLSPDRTLINSIWCGFIMTTVVNFGRQERWLPLIFGVPVFILCGFLHSIADAFYYSIAREINLVTYSLTVLGNFIGCNLYRLIIIKS